MQWVAGIPWVEVKSAGKLESVRSILSVDLSMAEVAWIATSGVFLAVGVRGGVHTALNLMGFDSMVGGVDQDMLRWSVWPATVKFGVGRIDAIGL